MTPSIRLVAWEDRMNQFIFVAVPNERGRYIRTHKCVAFVACPACNSIPGQPCISPNSGRYWAGTHGDRNTAYARQIGWGNARSLDIVDVLDGANEPPPIERDYLDMGAAPWPPKSTGMT